MNESLDASQIRAANASALKAIALITRYHECSLDLEEMKQHYVSMDQLVEPLSLVRALQDSGLKAGLKHRSFKKLSSSLCPLIIILNDGGYAVAMKVDREGALIHFTGESRPRVLSKSELETLWGGDIIAVVKKKSDERQEKFGFRWFARTFLKYRSIMRDTLLASVFIQVFALVTPLIFMIVIDKVLSHNSLSTLRVLIFAMIVMVVFEVMLTAVRTYLISHTSNRIDLELGIRVFRHLLALPMSYFEARSIGDTTARVRELETVRQFITGSGLTLVIDLFFVMVFIAVMYLFSSLLATVVVVSLPIYFIISWMATPLLKDKLEDKYKLGADNQSFLVESVGGIETIKSSAIEGRVQRDYEHHLGAYVKSSFQSGQLANYTNQATSLVSKSVTVIILWYGANQVMAGGLTVGQLIAFNMLASRVSAPILRLAGIWKEFQQMGVSVSRLADILDSPTETGNHEQKTALGEVEGAVEFDHVTFRYGENSPIALDDVSFSAKAGEVIGVVGSSGSGKTTLVKLIQRLYIPEKGRVLVDGMNTARVDPAWLRRQIGVVAQDTTLFRRTVRENIALGDPLMEDGQIIDVAKMVGIHKLILSLPEGYDTMIHEKGNNLSAGQRQRIALARALATNPKLLILDEATSALDTESEQAIQERMQAISRGRTVFMVAHRLSTLRLADRILTIEDGRLLESGPPEELRKARGRFWQLYQLQTVAEAS